MKNPDDGPHYVLTPDEDRLRGYVACAITGLSEDQEALSQLISREVARIASEWSIQGHQPIVASNPRKGPGVEMDPEHVHWLDRTHVTNADVLFEICDHPSFGLGREDGLAETACVPVIRIMRKGPGKHISKMIGGGPTWCIETIEYEDPGDLEIRLHRVLSDNIANLRRHKARRESAKDFGITKRLKDLRFRRKASTKEQAEEMGVSPSFIERLESEPEIVSNLSLMQLKMIAEGAGLPLKSLFANEINEDAALHPIVGKSLETLKQYALERGNQVSFPDHEILKRDFLREFNVSKSQQEETLSVGGKTRFARPLEIHDWAGRHKTLNDNSKPGETPDLFGGK